MTSDLSTTAPTAPITTVVPTSTIAQAASTTTRVTSDLSTTAQTAPITTVVPPSTIAQAARATTTTAQTSTATATTPTTNPYDFSGVSQEVTILSSFQIYLDAPVTLLLAIFPCQSGVVLIAPSGKGVVAWMRGNSAARRDFLCAKLALCTQDRY